MSAFILTADGVAGMANNIPFNASNSHPNYQQIISDLKAGAYDRIHDLINTTHQIKRLVSDTTPDMNGIVIDTASGVVLIDGHELDNAIVGRIIRMATEGFDVQPLRLFLANMMQLPKVVADRVFEWVEAGAMPITSDGCVLAYKRVRDDYTSFYDGKTRNDVHSIVSIPRALCDDDQRNTCSAGLHFCSQEYLPQYHGGAGRVLVLKINPKDIVAIPFEYGISKGRACRYEVVTELLEAPRQHVETSNPIQQAVVHVDDIKRVSQVTESFINGYLNGYAAGKAKSSQTTGGFLLNGDYNDGYSEGYKDGRGHKARRFKALV